MSSIAVYPGSFDPFTNGHGDILYRALPFFSVVHVIVAEHPTKATLFTVEERVAMIKEITSKEKNIVVTSFEGLVVDYAHNVKASAIVRGLRAVSDFDYEFQLATMNRRLAGDIETIFFTTRGKYFYVNSSGVKDISRYGGDVSAFVSPFVEKKLKEKFKK
ncbi:MAG: pantetheine-phosphate adenylyltransferase [bacterium]